MHAARDITVSAYLCINEVLANSEVVKCGITPLSQSLDVVFQIIILWVRFKISVYKNSPIRCAWQLQCRNLEGLHFFVFAEQVFRVCIRLKNPDYLFCEVDNRRITFP
jgi:hypothetical protein